MKGNVSGLVDSQPMWRGLMPPETLRYPVTCQKVGNIRILSIRVLWSTVFVYPIIVTNKRPAFIVVNPLAKGNSNIYAKLPTVFAFGWVELGNPKCAP